MPKILLGGKKKKKNNTTEDGESKDVNDRSNSGASTVDREFVMGYGL